METVASMTPPRPRWALCSVPAVPAAVPSPLAASETVFTPLPPVPRLRSAPVLNPRAPAALPETRLLSAPIALVVLRAPRAVRPEAQRCARSGETAPWVALSAFVGRMH